MTSPVDQQDISPASNLPAQYGGKREFWLTVAVLTGLYLLFVAIGNRRYVWFDELFTFDIARSPSIEQLWNRELRFDCNPPTVYLLSRASMSIFGPTPLGLRFPSMVEFYFGSMAMLLYARRKAGIAFAALAVLLLWTVEPTLYYAVEARPYALIFLSFSCLLLSWDIAIRTQRRRMALFGVAISTMVLAAAHVFTLFSLFAFFVAEAVRFLRRREPDFPLWGALAIPMLIMLIYVPLIRSCGGIVFPVAASPNTIVLFFEATLGSPVIAAVLLVILMIPAARGRLATSTEFASEEITLFACLCFSPILLNLFLMYRKTTFYNRYCLATQVAILVAIAILLPYRMRLRRWAAYAGSLVLLLFLLKTQVWHMLRYPPPRNAAFLRSVYPGLPLVIGEGQVFIEMNRYENADLLSRVYFLKDPQASMHFAHTNLFQDFAPPDVMRNAGFPITANIESYASFVGQHREFLLLSGSTKWIFLKLVSSGASVAVVGDYAGSMPYLDTTLYKVTMPSE
jgi:uncharacterized membrane protein